MNLWDYVPDLTPDSEDVEWFVTETGEVIGKIGERWIQAALPFDEMEAIATSEYGSGVLEAGLNTYGDVATAAGGVIETTIETSGNVVSSTLNTIPLIAGAAAAVALWFFVGKR